MANEPFLFASPGRSLLGGQGAGVGRAAYNGSSSVYGPGSLGALVDGAGHDRYESTASAPGSVRGEQVASGEVVHQVQGSVELPADLPADLPATGYLADLGVADGGDEFVQVPAVPTCNGSRGEDVWVDRNPIGIGTNGSIARSMLTFLLD